MRGIDGLRRPHQHDQPALSPPIECAALDHVVNARQGSRCPTEGSVLLSQLGGLEHLRDKRGIKVHLIRADTPTLSVDDFDARFERARPRVLAVARSILGAQHAEDIVQDTYLAARSRIDQLRDLAALDRWLARIAENLCYQALRRTAMQDGPS